MISDAHGGLKRALSEMLAGAGWQRCRVHFMRSLLSRVSRHAQAEVTAWVRTIFAQPDQGMAGRQPEPVAEHLEGRFPKVAGLLREAAEDVLAYMAFPPGHRRRIHSTNPLERLLREVGRRCDVVGIFPNPQAALRLIGAVLIEQQDEWEAGRRYFSLASMAALYGTQEEEENPVEAVEEVLTG